MTPNRISIDTGAYRSGILTAAVIDGPNVSFLQAIGEPDRAALVREAILVEGIEGRVVTRELQALFDDFLEGRIELDEMTARRGLAAAA